MRTPILHLISVRLIVAFSVFLGVLNSDGFAQAQLAEPWETEYESEQAQAAHVIGLWQFNAGHETEGSSKDGHTLRLNGGTIAPNGKFGSCLESGAGWPVSDKPHSAVAENHPQLSPNGPFTLELWVNPKPEYVEHKGNCYLLDKKYASHVDYQLLLDPPVGNGNRTLRANLGFGSESETWFTDEAVHLEPGVWTHLAMTYDGAGTVRFYINGIPAGHQTIAGRGSIAPGLLGLSIGDRLGSNYGGFPGFIDQVRLCSGIREFRAISVIEQNSRHAFLRGETPPELSFQLTNHYRHPLEEITATISIGGLGADDKSFTIERIESGANYELPYSLNTSLRPDKYPLMIHVTARMSDDAKEKKAAKSPDSKAADGNAMLQTTESFPFTIVSRPNPFRMPVVMWGIGGIDGAVKEFPRLKSIGFTHCLGLSCDYDAIWKAGQPVSPLYETQGKAADKMLD
ncbi:MAG: LamG domain-containing protein, partial [Planctomycetaceae bacterium]